MRGYRKHWSAWVQLAREIWCFLAGHRWASSWRRVGEWDWHRSKRGNPYYDYVASWRGKCRRCRMRTRDEVWAPVWIMAWHGLTGGVGYISILWNCYSPWGPRTRKVEGKGYRISSVWNLWWLLLAAPVSMVKEVVVHLHDETWMPWTVVTFWCDVDYWLMERMEKNTTYYTWLPPDGDNHGIVGSGKELGLWMRSDLVDKDPLKRMRVFVQSSGGSVTLCA